MQRFTRSAISGVAAAVLCVCLPAVCLADAATGVVAAVDEWLSYGGVVLVRIVRGEDDYDRLISCAPLEGSMYEVWTRDDGLFGAEVKVTRDGDTLVFDILPEDPSEFRAGNALSLAVPLGSVMWTELYKVDKSEEAESGPVSSRHLVLYLRG